jgi:hypothetical protein
MVVLEIDNEADGYQTPRRTALNQDVIHAHAPCPEPERRRVALPLRPLVRWVRTLGNGPKLTLGKERSSRQDSLSQGAHFNPT